MSKQQWPIDFDSLVKDSLVSQELVERAYAVKCATDPDVYAHKLMALCEEIRKHRPDLDGNVRVDHKQIRIMTDTEADDWQDKRFKESVHSIYRIGKRRAQIDRSKFNQQRIVKCESMDMTVAGTIVSCRNQIKKHERLMRGRNSHKLTGKT